MPYHSVLVPHARRNALLIQEYRKAVATLKQIKNKIKFMQRRKIKIFPDYLRLHYNAVTRVDNLKYRLLKYAWRFPQNYNVTNSHPYYGYNNTFSWGSQR